MKKFMNDKIFTYTLPDIPKNFKNLYGGAYSDSDIDLRVKILSVKDEEINISLSLNKYPSMVPFWSIFYVKIHEQEDKVFIEKDQKGKRLKQTFTSIFTKSTFRSNTTITYKIIQIPSYICSLENESCVCYLNCSIQLLFHLSKFRSFLFNTFIGENENDWLRGLVNLFQQMCTNKSHISNENLTESFGWPTSARHIQHDSSEFVQILLEKIDQKFKANKTKKDEFDQIFCSQILCKTANIEDRYLINLQQSENNESLFETIQKDMTDSKFVKFPEVLFLTPTNLNIEKVTQELDLTSFSADNCQNRKNGQYVLSGVILRILKKNDVHHFTSFVRASTDDIWLYFNDTMQITYNFQYSKKLKQIEDLFDSQIKKRLNAGEIHLLMYISKDVIGEYFTFTPANPRFRQVCEEYNGSKRLIMITKVEDIKKHVQSGRTDFEDVESSIYFEIDENMSYSDVYKKVSEIEKKPIGTFALRHEGETKAPSFRVLPNDENSLLKNFRIYRLHYYYEEVTQPHHFMSQFIPFYFLLFKFKPTRFLNNISDRLVRRKIDFTSSAPIPFMDKKKIGRQNSSNIETKEKKKKSKKKPVKNSFQYLTNIVLKTTDTFESILNDLFEIINGQEKSKKHQKINLYFALYDKNGKEKIGYKKIDLKQPIYKCLQQTNDGTYIYVQCEDDYIKKDKNLHLEQKVQTKFLFFKYFQLLMKENSNSSLSSSSLIYPKEITNVFMMEEFSIPVTFCDINNPKIKSKTILFPTVFNLKTIEIFKRFVCFLMNENYPGENQGLMQFFIGFKSEKLPPFHDPLFENNHIKFIYEIINKSLEYGDFSKKHIEETFEYDYEEDDEELKEIESDIEYVSNVYIHYNIFNAFNFQKEISFRVYFSEDSINVNLVAQAKLPKGSTVKDLTLKLRSIFGSKFSEEDDQKLKDYENNKLNFTDHYRILQTSNGKISREIQLSTEINSNFEIRFERIPQNFNKDEIFCYIPVFYGARYSPLNDRKYRTNYIGAFGTPFYFPVLKSDIDNSDLENKIKFMGSSLYKRLRSMISVKQTDFNLSVVNYSGLIQDVGVNELKTIIDRKLYYSICIRKLNSSLFIDETTFFRGDLRIIT